MVVVLLRTGPSAKVPSPAVILSHTRRVTQTVLSSESLPLNLGDIHSRPCTSVCPNRLSEWCPKLHSTFSSHSVLFLSTFPPFNILFLSKAGFHSHSCAVSQFPHPTVGVVPPGASRCPGPPPASCRPHSAAGSPPGTRLSPGAASGYSCGGLPPCRECGC